MALTEVAVKQAKAGEKTRSMSDGKGLLLEVRPNGRKYWIVRYWVNGKEKRSSLGAYPEVSLKEAREKNYELRRVVASGSRPDRERETFADVVNEWLEARAKPKFSESYMRTVLLRLGKFILPEFGHLKIGEITSSKVLALCRRIEASGTVDTSHRVKQLAGQIFRFAIVTDRVDSDPTVALYGALSPHKERHYSSVMGSAAIGALIRSIEGYPQAVVRCALRFSALVFCRPGNVRMAEWSEIDPDRQEWRISGEKMKMDRPHIVPLARQTVELLEELREFTGRGRWLFPSARRDGRCMSENTIRVALRSMGYGNEDMTAHGFRSMASTTLNEHGWPVDVIERQLAHAEKNAVRAAYNHAEYLPQRREMMQWWADFLDEVKAK